MTQNNKRGASGRFTDRLGRLVQRFRPEEQKIRDSYLEHLMYEHRTFDVKGLTTQGVFTLELEQVFVELGLVQQAVERISTDPLGKFPQTGLHGRGTVWEHLQISSQPLVIVGAPGRGKTTLLKHMAISLANPDGKTAVSHKNWLPIVLYLRTLAPHIQQDAQYSLVDGVQAVLEKWDIEIDDEWFNTLLSKGQCLIMLDGLDEVGDASQRRAVVAWVERQIAEHGRNQFVITARPYGYRSNPIAHARVIEVLPLRIGQIRQFVHNWYIANEIKSAQRDDPGVRRDAREGAEDLMLRLRRTYVLLDMAVNPLLLTMIATVHRYRGSLPGRRVELYAEICDVFLGKRQMARGLRFDLTPAQKQRVLRPLAYEMMKSHRRELPVHDAAEILLPTLMRVSPKMTGEQFLREVLDGSGLMIEKEAGLYGFAHLTFQEYLAAVHVREQRKERRLMELVEDSWWHETIRLYAAMGDATNIIQACLSRRTASVPALTLAVECLEEAREVKAELRNIFDQLEQAVDHPTVEVQQMAAEVRLVLRSRRLMRVDDDWFVDNNFVTNAEYQLFLDDRRTLGGFHHPDHWRGHHFPSGWGRYPVTGIRPLDAVAFCEWLSNRLPGEWYYRLPKAKEVSRIVALGISEANPEAPIGYWVVTRSGFTCTPLDETTAVAVEQWLLQLQDQFFEDWSRHQQLSQLPQARDLILTRARHRSFMLQNLDRETELDALQATNFMRDLRLIRDRRQTASVHAIEQYIRFMVTNSQSLSVEDSRRIDIDPLLNLVWDIESSMEHKTHLGKAPQLARSLARTLETASGHIKRATGSLQRDLLRGLYLAMSQANELNQELSKAINDARSRLRLQSLAQIDALLEVWEQNPPAADVEDQAQIRRLLTGYIDLYLDFAILEGRIQQKLPALEGLLLIRERKGPIAPE